MVLKVTENDSMAVGKSVRMSGLFETNIIPILQARPNVRQAGFDCYGSVSVLVRTGGKQVLVRNGNKNDWPARTQTHRRCSLRHNALCR